MTITLTHTRNLLATMLTTALLGVMVLPATAADTSRIGVILGGGGETGIAWETGVLAALADKAGLTFDKVDIVVGTSAGAFAGDYYASGVDLAAQVENERTGKVVTAPVHSGDGMSAIPPEMMAALLATDGTIEERGQRIGKLAVEMKTAISSADLVSYVGTMLAGPDWPQQVDLRVTTVDAETGKTVLWDRDDGVPLAAAVASSAAVPGFMPAVEIDGRHYTDAPRTPFSPQIVAEKGLNAIVYIGLPTPNLSNTVEEAALTELEGKGIEIVRITGGESAAPLIAGALDPSLRPQAVEVGLADGAAAAEAVAALLR
jgi:NTE family protein